jgi:hypothetical protein
MITSADIQQIGQSTKVFFTMAATAAQLAVVWVSSQMYSLSQHPRVQGACLYLIMTHSRAQTNCYLAMKHLYDQNELIRVPVDFAIWSYEQVELMNLKHRCEPASGIWINVCSSICVNQDDKCARSPYHYVESYNVIDLNVSLSEMKGLFNEAIEMHADIEDEMVVADKSDTVVVAKMNGFYKIMRSGINRDIQEFTLAKSTVRFLSVEYHGAQNNSLVVLTVPKTMCMQNNELFSAAFVRRLLEYQSDSFTFDMDYTLKIIDSEVKSIQLKSNQYIVLGETDYLVETL